MHYLFELFSELLPNPTAADIYTFCRDHFIFAVVIAFVILAVIGAVLLSSLMEFARKIVHVKESRSAKLMMTLFSVAGVLLSVVFVTLILRRLEPIPLFNEGPRTFIREPIVLSWKFNSLSPTERPVYEVENSATSDFSKSTKDIYDGNSLYSYQEEGPRWWRVRAKVGEVNGEIVWSRASRPLQTNYFPNSYSQIKNRGELVVYVSNSVTQGIFRFLKPDGKLGGVDITLSEQIAIALTRELGKPIKARYIPVPWVNLLKMPSSGQADIIISSISNRPEREFEHQITFSQPNFCTGQSLIYRKSDWPADIPVRDMLKGKTVGYEQKSTSEDLIEKLSNEMPGIRKQPSGELEQLIQSLLAPHSNIQIIITDTPFALERLLRGDAINLASKPFLASDFPATALPEEREDKYAIAVAQGETQLLKTINGTIAALLRDKGLPPILSSAVEAIHPGIAPGKQVDLTTSLCPG